MRQTPLAAAVVLALTVALAPVARAEDGNWFDHNGTTVEEVLAGQDGSFVVVLRSGAGEYALLTSQEPGNGALTVVAVGTEQVRVRPQDAQVPVMLPILHRNLPLDILTLAACRLQGKQVVLAGALDAVLADSRPVGLGWREELGALLEKQGHGLIVFDDLAVVGKKPATELPAAFNAPAPGETPVVLNAVRAPLGALVDKLRTGLPAGVELTFTGDPNQTVTVFASQLTPSALAHYLNGAASAGLTVKNLVPLAPAAASAAAVRAPLPAAQAAAYFDKVRALAKAGRTHDAVALLVKLIKRQGRDARLLNALAKLYWKLGNREKAINALNLALKADPQDAFARETLARLTGAGAKS